MTAPASLDAPTTVSAPLCEGLAALLRYPASQHRAQAASLGALAASEVPEIAALIDDYLRETAALDTAGLEELYTVSFDLSPVVTLEVGWHLFGEQYERGAFLARLRGELLAAGIDERGELPDHLTVVLPLLGRLSDASRRELIREKVAPALLKIRCALDDTPNPYRHLLAAVDRLLARLAGAAEPVAPLAGDAPGAS